MGGRKMDAQNFSNHGRYVPVYHFFAVPVLAVNLFWSLYRIWKLGFSFATVFGVIFAAALAIAILEARLFALAVEERLRYAQVLPADLQARTGELTIAQIVSLRFACDAELPVLARKVLDEKLTERKAIKQLIKSWRPDYQRA